MVRATQSSIAKHPPANPSEEHVPVMLKEVIDLLRCKPGGVFVDATVGLGGHARAILELLQPGGMLIGLDRDGESLEKARVRLEPWAGSARLMQENFKNLPLVISNLAVPPLDGILIDLGISSFQMLSEERGFSFQSNARLDMRMDRTQPISAADLVNSMPEQQLADVIYQFGEERLSRRIAAAIVRAREEAPITRCSRLAEIVSRAMRVRSVHGIHPATRTFQALRIAVNQELEGLEEFFMEAISFLRPGGRLVAISFHSLEDRIVKRSFRRLAGQCVCDRSRELCQCSRDPRALIVTPKALKPGVAELDSNPRSRSARLRAVERI